MEKRLLFYGIVVCNAWSPVNKRVIPASSVFTHSTPAALSVGHDTLPRTKLAPHRVASQFLVKKSLMQFVRRFCRLKMGTNHTSGCGNPSNLEEFPARDVFFRPHLKSRIKTNRRTPSTSRAARIMTIATFSISFPPNSLSKTANVATQGKFFGLALHSRLKNQRPVSGASPGYRCAKPARKEFSRGHGPHG